MKINRSSSKVNIILEIEKYFSNNNYFWMIFMYIFYILSIISVIIGMWIVLN